MMLIQSEPKIFIKVIPDSLYASFTNLDVEIYPNQKINSYSICFPNENIISVEIEKGFLRTFSSDKVIIFNYDKEINFRLKIDKAVEDSGDINFPLVSTKLQMVFFIEFESEIQYKLRIQTLFPKDCKGYINDSHIKIGNKKCINGTNELIQLTEGYPNTNISYYTQNVESNNKRTEVEIETYYCPSPLLFFPSLLFPPIFGLLISAILVSGYGLSQKDPITITIVISIFAIIFTIWYKVAPIGMTRVPSLLNHTIIFWALILILYAFSIKLFEINPSEFIGIFLFFVPYSFLITLTLTQLYNFYLHPTQKMKKSKLFMIKTNEFINQIEEKIIRFIG